MQRSVFSWHLSNHRSSRGLSLTVSLLILSLMFAHEIIVREGISPGSEYVRAHIDNDHPHGISLDSHGEGPCSRMGFSWTQTTYSDYKNGTLTNVDINTIPGDILLYPNIAFSENFTNSTVENQPSSSPDSDVVGNNGNVTWVEDTSVCVHTQPPYSPMDSVAIDNGALRICDSGNAGVGDHSRRMTFISDNTISGSDKEGFEFSFSLGLLKGSAGSGAFDGRITIYDGINSFSVMRGYESYSGIHDYNAQLSVTTGEGTILLYDEADDNIRMPGPRGTFSTVKVKIINYPGRFEYHVDGVQVSLLHEQAYIDLDESNTKISLSGYRWNWKGPLDARFDDINVSFGYVTPGEFVSQPHDTGFAHPSWESINWTGHLPEGTDITLRTRTAPDNNGTAGNWSDWSPPYTSNGTMGSPSGQWVRWSAALSTINISNTPGLREVTIHYRFNIPPAPPDVILPDSTPDPTPCITWSGARDAENATLTYKISIGTVPGAQDVMNWMPTGINARFNVTAPLARGTYHVGVKANDGIVDSSVYEEPLIIINAPPSPPDSISPAETTNKTPLIRWFNASDVNDDPLTYYVRVTESASGEPIIDWRFTGEDNFILIDERLAVGEYSVFIMVNDTIENSTLYEGTIRIINTKPEPPSSFTPDATSTRTPLMEWFGASDIDGDPLTHYIRIGTSMGEDDILSWNRTGGPEYQVETPLEPGTYRVLIKVHDGTEFSIPFESSLDIHKENTPPSPPTFIRPGYTTDPMPHITWFESTDADNDTLSYYIRIGTTPVGDEIIPWSRTDRTYWDVGSPLCPDKYYIQIKASDGKANSSATMGTMIVLEKSIENRSHEIEVKISPDRIVVPPGKSKTCVVSVENHGMNETNITLLVEVEPRNMLEVFFPWDNFRFAADSSESFGLVIRVPEDCKSGAFNITVTAISQEDGRSNMAFVDVEVQKEEPLDDEGAVLDTIKESWPWIIVGILGILAVIVVIVIAVVKHENRKKREDEDEISPPDEESEMPSVTGKVPFEEAYSPAPPSEIKADTEAEIVSIPVIRIEKGEAIHETGLPQSMQSMQLIEAEVESVPLGTKGNGLVPRSIRSDVFLSARPGDQEGTKRSDMVYEFEEGVLMSTYEENPNLIGELHLEPIYHKYQAKRKKTGDPKEDTRISKARESAETAVEGLFIPSAETILSGDGSELLSERCEVDNEASDPEEEKALTSEEETDELIEEPQDDEAGGDDGSDDLVFSFS